MLSSTTSLTQVGFTAKLHQIVSPLRQTLTYDQGRKMARHHELARDTNMHVYLCDPYSPWQRGTCENTSGLQRQFLPKDTDLSVCTQEQLDPIADMLNNRPRAMLDWRSPIKSMRNVVSGMADKHDFTIH